MVRMLLNSCLEYELACLFSGKHLPLNYEGNLTKESKQSNKISLKALMRIVEEEHGKEVGQEQKVDLHSVTMGNEHYTTSNKWGKVPLKT